jgi:signal transduction histidine kinase
MISYFMLAVVWKDHRFQLESSNMLLYLFNQFAGIVFIFYGLFLIKKENTGYQSSVLSKNREIAENASLLQKQTTELTELNALKNKLFSVIAHDLKTPMYALRNLFRTIQQQNIPAKEIKAMLPDMVNGLNYTTSLMENLLQWAKCQMQSEGAKIQILDIAKMIEEVIQLLRLQAEAKQLWIESTMNSTVLIMADKDMIDLVLRNLLSNAIKFTPTKGKISIGVNEMPSCAEVFVKDTGRGISPEAMQKIGRNDYFSTNGTAHEPGTGLGLMLCKDFLKKNGAQLFIESEPEKGSRFSFSLPIPE